MSIVIRIYTHFKNMLISNLSISYLEDEFSAKTLSYVYIFYEGKKMFSDSEFILKHIRFFLNQIISCLTDITFFFLNDTKTKFFDNKISFMELFY